MSEREDLQNAFDYAEQAQGYYERGFWQWDQLQQIKRDLAELLGYDLEDVE